MSEQTAKRGSLQELAASLISVTEASQLSGFTTGYIRRLLRNGTIEGVKIGPLWYTTEEAIQEYLKTERRPGPKTE